MAKRLSIGNFKFGLDARKSELTSVPGTLVQAENGHINEGAEFEKRKAFVLQGTLPHGCFGLQETADHVYTFGSATTSIATTRRKTTGGNLATLTFVDTHGFAVGDIVTVSGLGAASYNGTFTLTAVAALTISYAAVHANEDTVDAGGTVVFPVAGSLPTGVTYQRLRHYMCYYNGQTFNVNNSTFTAGFLSAEPVMTAVLASCSFNNQTFVAASYAAGSDGVILSTSTILFANAVPLIEQALGRNYVFSFAGNSSYMVEKLILALSHYFGTDFRVTGYGDGTNFYQITITGPNGQVFSLTLTSSTGLLANPAESAVTAPVTAVGAKTTFYLTAGNSGSISVLTAPAVVDGAVSGTVSLISGAIAYATSLLITAQNLANDINQRTATTGGYTAIASLADISGTKVAKVVVSAPSIYGAIVNTSNVALTTTGTIKNSAASTPGGGAVGATNYALLLGVTSSTGSPQTDVIDFTGTAWANNATWSIVLTTNDIEYTIGNGNIGGIVPAFVMALGNKVYVASTNQFNFSAIDNATEWEDQDTGAGFIVARDQYASPSNVVALAPYQGRLAIFNRRSIQIYAVNADPAQYSQTQSLQNIGAIAKLSVQPVGELDVLFLSDTGVRSLRVRDSTLNAYVVDVGSAVDAYIQAAIIAAGATASAAACGIVEPSSNRYWIYLNGKIYTLSLFPSLKIVAWSTYLPTYEVTGSDLIGTIVGNTTVYNVTAGNVYVWTTGAPGVLINGTETLTTSGRIVAQGATISTTIGTVAPVTTTTFTPVKFLVYAGQVYCLASDGKVFLYGGADNNTYDGCVATIELPWLDGKEPHKVKLCEKISAAMAGEWQIEAGADPRGATPTQIAVPYITPAVVAPNAPNDSTFDNGSYAIQSLQGTHLKAKAYTKSTYTKVATFSAITFTYNEGDEQ